MKVALLDTLSGKRLDALQGAELKLEQARDYARAIVETILPQLVLDPDRREQTATEPFYDNS